MYTAYERIIDAIRPHREVLDALNAKRALQREANAEAKFLAGDAGESESTEGDDSDGGEDFGWYAMTGEDGEIFARAVWTTPTWAAILGLVTE